MWSLFGKKTQQPEGACCVSFNSDGIALTHAITTSSNSNKKQADDSSVVIKRCDFLPCKNPVQRELVLGSYIKQNNLQNANCRVVLQPDEYRLFFLDAPNVPEQELKMAVRWLVKDLIDYPLGEAAVDYFEVPGISSQRSKIYVVATRLKMLQHTAQLMKAVNLKLSHVDIAELALANITSMLDAENKGVMLLSLSSGEVGILIAKGGTVCLTRYVKTAFIANLAKESQGENVPNTEVTSDHQLDPLILQIQRSLDFYRRQIESSMPAKIVLCSLLGQQHQLVEQLSKDLGIVVELLDLNELLKGSVSINMQQQTDCLTVIGEGLGINQQDITEF
jgi:MSHA biogenesis protein MshI